MLTSSDNLYLEAIKDSVIVSFPKVSGINPQIINQDLSFCTIIFSKNKFCVSCAGMHLDYEQVKAYVNKLQKLNAIVRQLNNIYKRIKK